MGNVDKIARIVLLLWILGVAPFVLCSCSKSKHSFKVGQHDLVIIETVVGEGPGSGKHVLPDIKGQPPTLVYESPSLIVRLEDEVLTVNGKRYILAHKDDSIRITDDRVEINGQPAKPEQ